MMSRIQSSLTLFLKRAHLPVLTLSAIWALAFLGTAQANPDAWSYEWPKTDFSKTSISFDEVKSGGPPKDGIPPIDAPVFSRLDAPLDLAPNEPVIGLTIANHMRAYPLRILMWHEIVNDVLGDRPVSITFCPLCNAAIVFDRRVDVEGSVQVLDFGTTGKLRNSDLIMWDRQTESWWQQFTGEAIVGALTGTTLTVLPSRLESWAQFQERARQAREKSGNTMSIAVLVPNDAGMRRYGYNPYEGYDSLAQPFLYNGETPQGLKPLERVVSLKGKAEAWSLAYLRQVGAVTAKDGTVVSWQAGQSSALDRGYIPDGKDVGTVSAVKEGADQPYFVDFAFAFHAFHPSVQITQP